MQNSDNSIVSYQATMLPNVDYNKIVHSNAQFSLNTLEIGTLESCTRFFNELKFVLREENFIVEAESLVAHLCAYLGAVMTVHTVHVAEKLELAVIELIQQQAKNAYQSFTQYPINNDVASIKHKEENLERLHQTTPSNIMTQTMRLNTLIMDIIREHKQPSNKLTNLQEQQLLCSQDTLTKIVLYLSGGRCSQWRKQLNGLSDNYVINQLAIQIGWVIGYFSHLDNSPPEQTSYFSYATSSIVLYRRHIFQLMQGYAEIKFAKETEDATKTNEILAEIHQLSEKTHAQNSPINDFQKQVLIVHAGIEKTLLGLLTCECCIKIMFASLFYFWFTLAESLYRKNLQSAVALDPMGHMEAIIHLVQKTIKSLPMPQLTPEINALNEKMQALKPYIANQENIDHMSQSQITEQTTQVNTAVYTATNKYLEQGNHPEAIANALFCHWMRLSVFFGVTEQDWQKMDYYVVEILNEVQHYFAGLM